MRMTETIRRAFVEAALEDIPRTNITEQLNKIVLPDCIAKMPASVQRAYREHPSWFALQRHRIGTAEVRLPVSDHYVVPPALKRKVQRAKVIAEQEQQRLWAIRRTLHAAAKAVNTTEQLAKVLPEFAQYIPAKAIAAAEAKISREAIVQDFKAAGWKKGKK